MKTSARKNDGLQPFLDACCVLGAQHFVRVGDLAAAYSKWARKDSRVEFSREHLMGKLYVRGYEQSRSRRIEGRQARTWEGIGLKRDVQRSLQPGHRAIPEGAGPAVAELMQLEEIWRRIAELREELAGLDDAARARLLKVGRKAIRHLEVVA